MGDGRQSVSVAEAWSALGIFTVVFLDHDRFGTRTAGTSQAEGKQTRLSSTEGQYGCEV
jgi:hypothetical protein